MVSSADYLAEALRELRRHNYTEVIDHHFGLGSQLKSCDVKAVRKTVAGLAKLDSPRCRDVTGGRPEAAWSLLSRPMAGQGTVEEDGVV